MLFYAHAIVWVVTFLVILLDFKAQLGQELFDKRARLDLFIVADKLIHLVNVMLFVVLNLFLFLLNIVSAENQINLLQLFLQLSQTLLLL